MLQELGKGRFMGSAICGAPWRIAKNIQRSPLAQLPRAISLLARTRSLKRASRPHVVCRPYSIAPQVSEYHTNEDKVALDAPDAEPVNARESIESTSASPRPTVVAQDHSTLAQSTTSGAFTMAPGLLKGWGATAGSATIAPQRPAPASSLLEADRATERVPQFVGSWGIKAPEPVIERKIVQRPKLFENAWGVEGKGGEMLERSPSIWSAARQRKAY
ncbi:hypothetical protein BJ546DRAFT_949207 [Cryomyces antarcticus]|nr:hypothetical protein LTR60_002543 [Cryomyces antarcticus]